MNTEQICFIEEVSMLLHSNFHIAMDVADFIGCQFALESNFGTSRIAEEFSNYCGMRVPLVRPSLALNYGNGYDTWARYSSMFNCVLDFMFACAYHRPLSVSFETINHYIYFIKPWYCPEKSYTDKINSLYVQFKSYKNGKN